MRISPDSDFFLVSKFPILPLGLEASPTASSESVATPNWGAAGDFAGAADVAAAVAAAVVDPLENGLLAREPSREKADVEELVGDDDGGGDDADDGVEDDDEGEDAPAAAPRC